MRVTRALSRSARGGVTAALLASGLLLGACASPPIETEVAADARRPDAVAAEPETASGDVLWGGVVIDARNTDTESRLEILAYPLDRRQRPQTGRAPEGRFLILAEGYLEPVDYAAGRLVTVLGALDGVREARVDEARLLYPAVRSSALHLWRPGDGNSAPRFTFGLGLGLDL